MDKKVSYERLALLFAPYGLAMLFNYDPYLSYFIAWLGSFFIFFVTLTGFVKPLPADRPFGEQIMRPLILGQLVFAGYMCCTSIFYFMNLIGYENFSKASSFIFIDTDKLYTTAQCQRYYCLAHASFVTGILLTMKYPEKQKIIFEVNKITGFLFYTAIFTFPIAMFFQLIPGLAQFSNQFSALSFIACTLALAFAIPEKKAINTIICLLLYASNLVSALHTGYKEPIIISVLVLGIFLYPTYKVAVITIFIPALIFLFIVLPTYAKVFRNNAWSGDTSEEVASQIALEAALNGDGPDDSNWGFLVGRLSEIDMFTGYVESTPDRVPYYGLTLLQQSAWSIVPRVFWKGKPNTEALTMERVYAAGVIYRGSNVSAKPAFIVDSYLSGGTIGIIIALFLYGVTAQFISQKAEELFGGYLLGTALIYSGLFQVLWRGLSYEFLINTVFWSYVTMLILQRLLLARNILQTV